jgi:hypothetical protein
MTDRVDPAVEAMEDTGPDKTVDDVPADSGFE